MIKTVIDFTALADFVAVEPEQAPEKTGSGLYTLQPVHVNAARWGTVVCAGPDAGVVSAGDRVAFHPGSGTPMDRDDRKMLLMRVDELMAVG